MQRKLRFILLCTGFVLLLNSCKYSEDYQHVNADNQFLVDVPSWMKKEDNLAAGAPFQYANRFRNFYAVGFSLNKDTATAGFDYYWQNYLNALKGTLGKPLVTDSVAVDVNGLKGAKAEIFGQLDGENIYFSEMLIEGQAKYYHLSIWVRGEERKLRFKEDINRILGSAREL